jgi:hypothetical protein
LQILERAWQAWNVMKLRRILNSKFRRLLASIWLVQLQYYPIILEKRIA